MNLATVKPSTIKQGALKRRVLAVVSAVGMAAVTLLQAMPASATEADGDPRMKCVQQDPYYFHGVSGLQGGFSTDAPTSPAPATQLVYAAHPSVHEGAAWADSFHGDLCGQATVTAYLASVRLDSDPSSSLWQIMVIADDDDTIARQTFSQDSVTSPEEVTFTVRLEATVAEKLEFWISPIERATGAVLYDSPAYAAGFTVSTLQPCEVEDPHPDCVEAGFADLAGDVRAFASTGEVTADGETQLLAALDQAETAYGDGDNAQAVAGLEHFQQLAADPALVPSVPARDTLTTTASGLITTLKQSEPA